MQGKILINTVVPLCFITSLIACGGGSGGGGNSSSSTSSSSSSGATDTTAPSASITFPPAISSTDSDSIVVRGTASDDSDITVVRVNNVDATSSDGFSNWEAAVPLDPGQNTLTVETGDIALNSNANAATATIERQVVMNNPVAVALDSDNNRALVVDATHAIVAVDLTPGTTFGERTVVSDDNTPNGDNPVIKPDSIALDSANNRALLVDDRAAAVFAVDLTPGASFGARIIISDSTTPNADTPFSTPASIAVDSDNQRALVVDRGLRAIVAVNLEPGPDFGARTIISDNNTPNIDNPFVIPTGIALDSGNNRALVADAAEAVVAVDLTPGASFGARTIVSDNNTPDAEHPFDNPSDITVDGANNRALVVDDRLDALFAVDLTPGSDFGARTVVSSNSTPNTDNPFGLPKDLALDNAGNRALIVDKASNSVIAVDLTQGSSFGTRTIISSSNTPNSVNPFDTLYDIALDSDNNRAVAINYDSSSLIEVNLAPAASFGARSTIPDNGVPNPYSPTVGSISVALDGDNSRALVAHSQGDAVFAVDLASGPNFGTRTVVSDNGTPDSDNPFSHPSAIAVDSDNNRALVLDSSLPAVFAVDLTPGASFGTRTIISDNSTPNANNPLSTPIDVVLDSSNNRALVVEMNSDAVIAVNMTPGPDLGARTIISDNSTPNGDNPLVAPSGIALDSASNRALVADIDLDAIVAVDLTPGPNLGARTILSGGDTPDANNPLFSPGAIEFDVDDNWALVVDRFLSAVFAVDLENGQRVLISH